MTTSARRQDYFEWLCDMVHLRDHNGKGYMILAKDLHKFIFNPILPMDENRADDGRELREEYARIYCTYADNGPCTMLELLIGVAKRMDFELCDPYDSDSRVDIYFWELIENLGIHECSDDTYFDFDGWYEFKDVLNTLNGRTYKRNGKGGLFPLRYPKGDQRKVEIWYQMHAYLDENYHI